MSTHDWISAACLFTGGLLIGFAAGRFLWVRKLRLVLAEARDLNRHLGKMMHASMMAKYRQQLGGIFQEQEPFDAGPSETKH